MRLWIVLGAVLTFGSLSGLSYGSPPDQKNQDPNVFSGIVEEVNETKTKILVKTDVGKAVEFELVKPELFKDIGKGDRITVELDEKGKATKVMKDIAIPELKSPPEEKK